MIRRFIKLIALLVVLVVVAASLGLVYMDSIARRAVEVAGTHVLGTPTTLQKMRISLFGGSVSMRSLDVANPTGFADPTFLAVQDASIEVDARSLLDEIVRIPSVRMNDLRVVLEQRSDTSNASVVLANMRRALGSGDGTSRAPSSTPGGHRYVIDEFVIDNIDIVAKSSGLPIVQPTVNLKVKQVKLQSIGSAGKDPVGLDQLTAMVVNAVMQAAIEAGGTQLPTQLVEGVLGGLGSLGAGATNFELSIDSGSGLKPIGDVAQLADRLGVHLGSVVKGLGGDTSKGIGETIGEVGKGAGDAIRKGVGDLFKK